MDENFVLHNIIIEERKKVNLSGVKEVVSFEDETIVLITTKGRLIIKGENLHIVQFDTKTNDLLAEGKVNAVAYQSDEEKSGLFSKLFR